MDSEEEYAAEEKLFNKTVSQRAIMAQREKRESELNREEWERIDANRRFFGAGKEKKSEARLEYERQLEHLVSTPIIFGDRRKAMNDHCANKEQCRFCNNYFAEEINVFDCKVEDPKSMPQCRLLASPSRGEKVVLPKKRLESLRKHVSQQEKKSR